MQKDQMGSGYLERREIKEVDHQCLQDPARGNRWRTQRNSGMKKIGCFASESWWYSFDTVNIGETSEGNAPLRTMPMLRSGKIDQAWLESQT